MTVQIKSIPHRFCIDGENIVIDFRCPVYFYRYKLHKTIINYIIYWLNDPNIVFFIELIPF